MNYESVLCGMKMPVLVFSERYRDNSGFPFVADCHFWGAEGAPILFSEIGFCMASCSYIYIYIIYNNLIIYMYISVKMAAPWGSLTLLNYYSLCPHLHSH